MNLSTIQDYESYLSNYPDSKEKKEAMKRAYNMACDTRDNLEEATINDIKRIVSDKNVTEDSCILYIGEVSPITINLTDRCVSAKVATPDGDVHCEIDLDQKLCEELQAEFFPMVKYFTVAVEISSVDEVEILAEDADEAMAKAEDMFAHGDFDFDPSQYTRQMQITGPSDEVTDWIEF